MIFFWVVLFFIFNICVFNLVKNMFIVGFVSILVNFIIFSFLNICLNLFIFVLKICFVGGKYGIGIGNIMFWNLVFC